MSTNILEKYVEKMRKLRRGEKGAEGPAPHKPLLLLSVIDLINQGLIHDNKILPSPDLAETFLRYWSKVVVNRVRNFAMPFFHLKGDKFWHLYPNPGKEEKLRNTKRIRKVSDLLEIVNYASLDADLFLLLTNQQSREIIRQTLVDKYFPNAKLEINGLLAEEQQVGEYRQLLLQEVVDHPFSYQVVPEPVEEENPNRSTAFRKEIMRLYNYSCAVCRLRIVTIDGESATDAAHIIPFHISHSDDIRNGISLCKLHHWAFDKGLISLSRTYKVMVSPLMSDRHPTEWLLTEQRDKSILLPEHDLLHPAQDALKWHRNEVLRE